MSLLRQLFLAQLIEHIEFLTQPVDELVTD